MYKKIFEKVLDDSFLKTEAAKHSYHIHYMGRYKNINNNEIFDLKYEKNCIETESYILDLNIGYNIESSHKAEILYMLYPKLSDSDKPWLTTIVLNKYQANLFIERINEHLLLGTMDEYFEEFLKKIYETNFETDKNEISTRKNDYEKFYGENAANLYKELISKNLSGKTISKRKDLGDMPGGLVYESKQLNINMWDLLEALEGMCHLGLAKEIDDSTYIII